jgi:hypothetical protein
MAGIHSKNAVVTLDTSGGTPTNISTYCNSVEINLELDEVDVTAFGATDRDYVSGFSSGTVSMGGPWTRALDNHMSPIYAAMKAGTLASVTLTYGPEGGDSGDIKYSGELTKMTWSGAKAGIDNALEWTAEFRITGAFPATTY